MTKKILVVLLAISVLGCAVFGWLWNRQRNDASDLERACAFAAGNANARFWDYLCEGNEYDYRYGVAELTAFYDAYALLCSETEGSSDTNCLHTNQLLGVLMDYPALQEEQVKMLVELTGLLKEDPRDGNAYILVFDLYNQLAR